MQFLFSLQRKTGPLHKTASSLTLRPCWNHSSTVAHHITCLPTTNIPNIRTQAVSCFFIHKRQKHFTFCAIGIIQTAHIGRLVQHSRKKRLSFFTTSNPLCPAEDGLPRRILPSGSYYLPEMSLQFVNNFFISAAWVKFKRFVWYFGTRPETGFVVWIATCWSFVFSETALCYYMGDAFSL